jgi:hypothetical protein
MRVSLTRKQKMLHQSFLQRLLAAKNNNRTAMSETYTNYPTHATVVSLTILWR